MMYDVIIVGGGPAGCACVLALKGSGLRVAILEKEKVPRTKICGESIGNRVKGLLYQIHPAYASKFARLSPQYKIIGTRYVAPNGSSFQTQYDHPGCTMLRSHFDTFLWDLCSEDSGADCFDGAEVIHIHSESEGYCIETKQGDVYRAGFLVGSDGTFSRVVSQLIPTPVDRHHYSVAVRTYFKGVADVCPHMMELFILDSYLPGYFWIFPLPNNLVNVGFGMLSRNIQKSGINVRQALKDILSLGILKGRIQNAEQIGSIQGWGLPLVSRSVPVSGHRLLLTGDAAHLVDCISGEGIANAMESGILAAEQIRFSYQVGRFDAPFQKQYDRRINQRIRSGQKIKAMARDVLGTRKRFLNYFINQASRNHWLNTWIRKTF